MLWKVDVSTMSLKVFLIWNENNYFDSQFEQKHNECRFGEEQNGGQVSTPLPHFPLLLKAAVELLYYINEEAEGSM